MLPSQLWTSHRRWHRFAALDAGRRSTKPASAAGSRHRRTRTSPVRFTPSRALGAACVALATAAGTLTAAYPAFAAGEAPLTALDAAYTQNFDTLASTGSSS